MKMYYSASTSLTKLISHSLQLSFTIMESYIIRITRISDLKEYHNIITKTIMNYQNTCGRKDGESRWKENTIISSYRLIRMEIDACGTRELKKLMIDRLKMSLMIGLVELMNRIGSLLKKSLKITLCLIKSTERGDMMFLELKQAIIIETSDSKSMEGRKKESTWCSLITSLTNPLSKSICPTLLMMRCTIQLELPGHLSNTTIKREKIWFARTSNGLNLQTTRCTHTSMNLG